MIDERKLIEDLKDFADDEGSKVLYGKALGLIIGDCIIEVEEQPKIGEWIPCSERLPEPGHRYLVSVIWEDEGAKIYSVYDAVYGRDGEWHSHNYECMVYCKIVAWQPMPEPYKE